MRKETDVTNKMILSRIMFTLFVYSVMVVHIEKKNRISYSNTSLEGGTFLFRQIKNRKAKGFVWFTVFLSVEINL